MSQKPDAQKNKTLGFYERVEIIGNKIPNPMVFFVYFSIIVKRGHVVYFSVTKVVYSSIDSKNFVINKKV